MEFRRGVDFLVRPRSQVFLRPLLKAPSQPHRLENVRNRRILATRLIPAFDSQSRRSGLLYYTTFDESSAMLIAPSNAVHTFFMRFPIDIAFTTRDGRIVKACTAVKPWRIAASFRGSIAIELPAGTLSRCETRAGDSLVILPAESSD
jgi:uncharacterized membrane protein (UPF0127 family)